MKKTSPTKGNTKNTKQTKKSQDDENPSLTIYVDTKQSQSQLEDNDVFVVHPSKLNFLGHFDKETFDAGVIQNSPSADIKTLGLFFLVKILKPNAKLDVIVDQPISVMQGLDASEIEANAKLAGFVDIEQSPYDHPMQDGDNEVTVNTILLSMTRPETLKKNVNVEIETVVEKKELLSSNTNKGKKK